MSDFLIMFLLYSCLSSVGCWSIKWRMRLKGGLSLHKQSSRVPGKSSFLTLISLGKYITKTQCGISRWHMSCLLSELKPIPAFGWPGRTGVPGHRLWFVPGTDLSPAVPRGARPSLSSVSQDKLSPALGWLLAQDKELLLPGATWSHMERARSWVGTAAGATPPAWRGRAGVRNCPAACPWQNHSGFVSGGSFGTA